MTGTGGIVEVQGTAETVPFTQESFDQLMVLAKKGIARAGVAAEADGGVTALRRRGPR